MSDYLGGTRVSELWSKIKERLSKKQDVLTGATGQLIGIGDDGAAQATVYPFNSDLLDNSLFVGGGSQQGGGQFPINQRGETEYHSVGYMIDRWKLVKPGAEIGAELKQDGISLSVGTAMQQTFETGAIPSGAVVSFSILVENKLISTTTIWDGSYKALKDADGLVLGCDPSKEYVQIYNSKGNAEDVLKAAKLELGPIQTLAHKEGDTWVLNDPPPNYALELAKCQRCQIELCNSISGWQYVGTGVGYSEKEARIFVNLPVTLRARPTVIFDGDWRLSTNGKSAGGIAVESMSLTYFSNNLACLYIIPATEVVVGQTYYLIGHASDGAHILLDCNP